VGPQQHARHREKRDVGIVAAIVKTASAAAILVAVSRLVGYHGLVVQCQAIRSSKPRP